MQIQESTQSNFTDALPKRFCSISEAARRCGVGRETIRKLFHKGILKGHKIGGLIRLDETIVNNYAEFGNASTTSQANFN